MNQPVVSVIIPAYKQAEFLADAIRSVLEQTYPHFELIVVNDASPDNTSEVVAQFDDRRIKYIVHEKNRRLPAARNTGILASSGDIIALLDADDYFHPDKLAAHVAFLEENPHIGVTYNARFNLNHSDTTIRELSRPPQQVSLIDLVLGFPFAPSDMVMRRDWVFRVGLFDESYVDFSEDLDINCRLGLAGCQFAGIDRALNYRRYQSGRVFSNIEQRIGAALRALDTVFRDSRCPKGVIGLRDLAYSNNYLIWAFYAFLQHEFGLAEKLLNEAIQLTPSVVQGKPSPLTNMLMLNAIADENVDHEVLLRQMFARIPRDLRSDDQCEWAVRQGYLLRGTRAVMWNRLQDGERHFSRAGAMKTEIDVPYLRRLNHQLLDYEAEFGAKPMQRIIDKLTPYVEQLGGQSSIRKLKGLVAVNQAFQSYRGSDFAKVPAQAATAILCDPKYLWDRGVLSILARSLLRA